MKNIIDDHEEVRQFVEKETGGFVEKIEGESTSKYKPTLNSLKEVFGVNRISYILLPDAAFLPTLYQSIYHVEVVMAPGTTRVELTVSRTETQLHIVRKLTERGVEYFA